MSQALHDRGFTGSRGFRVNSRGVALDDGPDGLSMGGGGGKTEVVVKGSSCKSAATRSLDDRSMLAIASIKARARTPQALWRAPTGAQARPITVCIIGCLCHPVAGGMTPRGLQTKTDERKRRRMRIFVRLRLACNVAVVCTRKPLQTLFRMWFIDLPRSGGPKVRTLLLLLHG